MIKNSMMAVLTMLTLLALASCEKQQQPPNAELTQTCVMNGYGVGHCTFTNTKTGVGTLCGKVRVSRTDQQNAASSAVFCSGKVEASSSKKVEFLVSEVREICDTDGSWTKVCDLVFIPES
jgi:hypothetical protein